MKRKKREREASQQRCGSFDEEAFGTTWNTALFLTAWLSLHFIPLAVRSTIMLYVEKKDNLISDIFLFLPFLPILLRRYIL